MSSSADVESVLSQLEALRADLVSDAAVPTALLDAVHPDYRDSARNLLHYLALRRHDLRPLQLRLAALGLSSLGRAESWVLTTVDTVLDVLRHLEHHLSRPSARPAAAVDLDDGRRLLEQHTRALLGPPSPGREVAIMVTMPSEAAREYTLVHDLLEQGMNCMRVNCAHDDETAWLAMIDNLRRSERDVGRSCRVVMDLAGPKLRTGPVEPGPAVVRVRPRRDAYGRVSAPARVWFTADTSPRVPPSPADASFPVPSAWLSRLRVGERVGLVDARGAKRSFDIVDVTGEGCWAETTKTAYVTPGSAFLHDPRIAKGVQRKGPVSALQPVENPLILHAGDLLVLTRDLEPGRAATRDRAGGILTPARIGCTIPEVFEHVQTGESIWFDDGKIGGIIETVESDRLLVRITQTRAGGAKLSADKGINLPDSDLRLAAMTAKDTEDLAFVALHADVVELSFVNTAGDVDQLVEHLQRLGSRQPAIVLKIETRRAFERLPDLLLAAMRWPCCGVMIARGDLAVECGFERLAEVQEEILWICEAAHIPVIWATQVLENLAKQGMASRAEITDAAMGHRAECVMLNKGPHVLGAVRVLDDILRRMQAHHTKKRSMLRELRMAHALTAESLSSAAQGSERQLE